jgi:hypothetical protein
LGEVSNVARRRDSCRSSAFPHLCMMRIHNHKREQLACWLGLRARCVSNATDTHTHTCTNMHTHTHTHAAGPEYTHTHTVDLKSQPPLYDLFYNNISPSGGWLNLVSAFWFRV